MAINSREWLAWIKRAPAASKAIGFKPLNPTKNIERKQEERKKAATGKEVRIGSKTVSIPGEFVFVDTTYRGGSPAKLYILQEYVPEENNRDFPSDLVVGRGGTSQLLSS